MSNVYLFFDSETGACGGYSMNPIPKIMQFATTEEDLNLLLTDWRETFDYLVVDGDVLTTNPARVQEAKDRKKAEADVWYEETLSQGMPYSHSSGDFFVQMDLEARVNTSPLVADAKEQIANGAEPDAPWRHLIMHTEQRGYSAVLVSRAQLAAIGDFGKSWLETVIMQRHIMKNEIDALESVGEVNRYVVE